MKNLCVIPARRGSKRLKNKNKIDFFGKPMISYTIESAIKSKCFEKILVSTDDLEIRKIAESYNVNTIKRKKGLAGDNISVSNVLIDIINNSKPKPEIITCLFPTAPMRNYNDIISVVHNVQNLIITFRLLQQL